MASLPTLDLLTVTASEVVSVLGDVMTAEAHRTLLLTEDMHTGAA